MEYEAHIRRLAEKVWTASKGNARQTKMVVLKLKTKEFSSMTCCLTARMSISSCEDLVSIALRLRQRVNLPPQQLYRLAGVGLSNFLLGDDAIEETNSLASPDAVADFLLQAQH